MERCHARTMEHFRRLGIADAVRNAGYPVGLPLDAFRRSAVTLCSRQSGFQRLLTFGLCSLNFAQEERARGPAMSARARGAVVKLLRVALPIALAAAMTVKAFAADEVRVGKAQGFIWDFLPTDVGIAYGIFAKYGLDVKITELGGDGTVQQAMVAGSIDFGLGSGPGMAFAAKGSP